MDTDQKILWLCEHGFTLPECLHPFGSPVSDEWCLVAGRGLLDEERYMVYDLCAAHMAREAKGILLWDRWRETAKEAALIRDAHTDFQRAQSFGDSAAAIDALYRAMKGSE